MASKDANGSDMGWNNGGSRPGLDPDPLPTWDLFLSIFKECLGEGRWLVKG